jgi:hypothetical protein
MTFNEMVGLFPVPNQNDKERIKGEHPYTILSKFAEAIAKSYDEKLIGVVAETTDITSNNILGYSFYLVAQIGKGYSYQLFELESSVGGVYPLKLTVFAKHSSSVMTDINNSTDLENALVKVFGFEFTKSLILQMLVQIDIYNESQK